MTTLYERCAFIPYWWVGEGIVKIQYGEQCKGICTEDILHTTTKTKKRFFNQSSLVFRLLFDGVYKETNIKLFKNGGFQMTGVSSEMMARASLTRLIEMNYGRGIWTSDSAGGTNTSSPTATPDDGGGEEEPKPYIKKFDICMMNSDYNIGRSIKRDQLYKILVEKYGLWSSYEPTIYQGVNTKFFWNKSRPASAPVGICVCPTPCDGSGTGYGIGQCKKITISPFRTGSIIITGAKHPEQLYDAYEFTNTVLRTYADTVLRSDTPPLIQPEKPTRTKKPTTPPTSTEEILRQKMRASPRNIVRITA